MRPSLPPSDAPPDPVLVGERGEYELLERIGAGGMAAVFRARVRRGKRRNEIVALKKILPGVAANPTFVTMFLDEARIAAQLDHVNIVKLLDAGRDDDEYFLVMEYIRGLDVRQILKRCDAAGLVVPVALTCTIVSRICDALSFAHNKLDGNGRPMRVVHRDVSPANVLISWDGETKLIDFGLAKAENRLAHTRTGILKGKLAYIAPEILRGAKADHRADIFGAGVMLWEMLTGMPLFDSPTDFGTLELVRACHVPPPSSVNPDVAPELDHVVLRALARDPDQRYQDAIEFHDELQDFLASSPPWTTDRIAAWLRGVAGPDGTRQDAAEPHAPGEATYAQTWVFGAESSAPAHDTEVMLESMPLTGSGGTRVERSAVRATVSLHSEPPGASVFVIRDGQRRKLGTTPIVTELEALPGYDLSMRKDGFAAWSQSLDLRSTSRVEVVASLVPRHADSAADIPLPAHGFARATTADPVVDADERERHGGGLVLVMLLTVIALTVAFGPQIWVDLFTTLRIGGR